MSSCWGLTDGSAGMVAQVKALASALSLTPDMKAINLRKPWVYLPPACYTGPLRRFILPHFLTSYLTPPWPEIVISCGRRAAIVALGLRAQLPATRFIHIQDPRIDSRHFDAIVAMQHDSITGPNVIKTRYALHTITPEALAAARAHFAPRFAAYPAPYTSVLIGGSTNKYTLTEAAMAQLIDSLQQLLGHTPGSLLITPSRRTGEKNLASLRQAFAGNQRVYIYDFIEENPYMGLLALADHLIVTDDSVNMMSEAAATGKPLHLLPLPGHADTKPARFAQGLIRDGIARPLAGRLESWDYRIENEMTQLATHIHEILDQ